MQIINLPGSAAGAAFQYPHPIRSGEWLARCLKTVAEEEQATETAQWGSRDDPLLLLPFRPGAVTALWALRKPPMLHLQPRSL